MQIFSQFLSLLVVLPFFVGANDYDLEWKHIGTLADFIDLQRTFPDTDYAYGVRTSGAIQEVRLNDWGGNYRLSGGARLSC